MEVKKQYNGSGCATLAMEKPMDPLLPNTPHGRRRKVGGVSGFLNGKLGFEIFFQIRK